MDIQRFEEIKRRTEGLRDRGYPDDAADALQLIGMVDELLRINAELKREIAMPATVSTLGLTEAEAARAKLAGAVGESPKRRRRTTAAD